MRMLTPLALAATLAASTALADAPEIQVFKTETCGCCNLWIEHMEAHGFRVVAESVWDLNAIKDLLGVPLRASSCHTGVVDGLVVEGHVPAVEVLRLLDERPAGIAGIAVPGMPQGSPGMPAAVAERYEVIGFGSGATERLAIYVGEERVD